jgi:hypothetical protein
MKNNKLYLGRGWTKTGKYGDFYNLQIDLNKLAENPNCIQKVGDRKFLNLTMGKLQKPLKAGQDLYVAWNDFTPAKTVEEKQGNDMPF